MELNNNYPPHDEATVSMKVVLLAFAVVLVGALGYLVMAQNRAVDTTDNSSDVVTPKTETTTTKTTTTDETADWKTYTNTKLGFTFKYPATYSISSDTLPETVTLQIQPPSKNLTLASNAAEKPKLVLYVNTDGFGPIFSDISYSLSLSSENKITLTSRKIEEVTDNSADSQTFIVASSDKKIGQNYLLFHYTFAEGGKDYEPEFKQIVETFAVN